MAEIVQFRSLRLKTSEFLLTVYLTISPCKQWLGWRLTGQWPALCCLSQAWLASAAQLGRAGARQLTPVTQWSPAPCQPSSPGTLLPPPTSRPCTSRSLSINLLFWVLARAYCNFPPFLLQFAIGWFLFYCLMKYTNEDTLEMRCVGD